MELIAIETDKGTSVMHYMGADTSDPAIAAEVKRAKGAFPWRRITASEYKAIRDARPKPKPALGPDLPANANADLHAALGVLVEAVERLDSKNKALEAKLEAVIDATVLTDVVEG